MTQTLSVLFKIELVIAFLGGFCFGFTILLEMIKDIGKFFLWLIKLVDRKIHTKTFTLSKEKFEEYKKIMAIPFHKYNLENFVYQLLDKGTDWKQFRVNKESGKAILIWEKCKNGTHTESLVQAKRRDEELKKTIGIASDLIDTMFPSDIDKIIKNKDCQKCPCKYTCDEGIKKLSKTDKDPVAPKKTAKKATKTKKTSKK